MTRRSLTTKQRDDFFSDLKRWGSYRAIQRDRNRDRIREFVLRQRQLAMTGALFILMFGTTGYGVFAAMAVVILSTAARECRRMRACGRYWQTKRSVEVIGI